ncbi:response regulator [Maritalea sp.]|uniref:response regulator n=1 Tax=Maritalea sp. TaxID=2003361 RepID=UPI0039E2EDC6
MSSQATKSPHQLKVLIVDDNQYACALATAQLKKLGIGETKSVSSGAEALLQLMEQDYDVLLTDWYMPDVSGAGLLGVVRDKRFKGNSNIAVVVMTAYASSDNIERALALGADEVVIKPANGTDLGKAIAKALTRKQPHSDAPANDEIGQMDDDDNDDFALL